MTLPVLSHPTQVQQSAAGVSNANGVPPVSCRIPLVAFLFVGVFGVLLASYPARNLDVWSHLAGGRELYTSGKFSPTWMYDVGTHLVYSVLGGGGLAAVKALLCGGVAVLLLRLGAVSGWRVALASTGLAVLAMSHRMLLQPQTASVILLAVGLWLTCRPGATRAGRFWPGWPLAVLFVAWANIDHWVVLGLTVVAAIRLGQAFDTRTRGSLESALLRWAVSTAALVALACLSVSNVKGLTIPPELEAALAPSSSAAGAARTIHSPFATDYFALFGTNSSALSYYPLLALSGLSFLLNVRGWRWASFLPWVLLAVVSGVEARAVPFFAVLAGPVTAWNLQQFFARRVSAPPRRWVRYAGVGLAGLVAVAFLLAAWPGWLQTPPYGPRQWAVEVPTAHERGAEYLRRTHTAGAWDADTRSLHASSDARGVFAWFCPEDAALTDDKVVAALRDPKRQQDATEGLRKLRVTRVVVWAGDPSPTSQELLNRLLATPDEWPVLHVSGGLVVFGWVDPAAPAPRDYTPWAVDFDRLAFRPDEHETAPPVAPHEARQWWEQFWVPAYPTRPPGRDEADVLLRRAESARIATYNRKLTDWEAGQLAGLVGAAGGWAWPTGGVDAAVRATLFHPPIPEGNTPAPPQTVMTLTLLQRFADDRGAIPIGEVYAAVRAARRAVAENPTDANAHRVLAQAYLTLIESTAEKRWSDRDGISELRRVRQIQASAALNKAVALNPNLAQAQLELSRLYRRIGCLDLAAEHLDQFRKISPLRGGPPKTGDQSKALDDELDELTKLVKSRKEKFESDSARASLTERAQLAVQMELGGTARDLLLKSDVSAFGTDGVKLELDLLLRTGRPDDVLKWTTPEVGGSLGDQMYHWTLARAHLALGDYESGHRELVEMVGTDGSLGASGGVVEEVASVVGKGVLDGVSGSGHLDQLVWQAISRADLQQRVDEVSQTLGLQANMITLRGVFALEAGDTRRARDTFGAALVYSPNPWGGGQLDFSGRRVARAALALLDRAPPER